MEILPEQDGHDDRHDYEKPAHGRGARLREMALRTILADLLPCLARAQLADQLRSEDERNDERRDGRIGGAEGDVLEDVEERKRLDRAGTAGP